MFPSTPTALVAAVPSLLRQGLVATLRERWPALRITLTADATQLTDLVVQATFDLVIMDGALPGQQLGRSLRRLYDIRPAQRLVVLTDQHLLPCAPAAATPLQLPRHIPPQTLASALASWLDAPANEALPHTAKPKAMVEPFSPRELQVLRLVVADHCNEEIADHLCLSVRTVESHRRTLLHKAGTRTLVGLAVRAVREGWVA